MNIYSYINKYGNIPFEEKAFNEVDNVIFSALSYINLNNIVSNNNSNKKTIEEVYNEFIKTNRINEKNIIAIKVGNRLLREIHDKKRYKDLYLYNYCYIGNEKEQFSALTIEINKDIVYVSFEGTDSLISGWKEDFMMSYTFPVLSQRQAINYINKRFTFTRKKIILGGHSKGGNLALISGMYSNFLIKRRIINIYNNDGPGLMNEQIESKYYKSIKDKLIEIIPNYSVVGLLLKHNNNYIVIKSTKKSILSHNLSTWVTENDKFKRSDLSNISKIIEEVCNNWLDQYNYKQREEFINELFKIFNDLNITNLTDIYKNKRIVIKIIEESKNINKETKDMITDLLYKIFNQYKETKTKEIQHIFKN